MPKTSHSGKQILPPKPGYCPLNVKSDVNAFLILGNNVVFLLSLQVWQLDDCRANNSQAFFNLFLADNQGRCQSDNVLVSGFSLSEVSVAFPNIMEGLTNTPLLFKSMHRSQAE
jgi:hypothetical protein